MSDEDLIDVIDEEDNELIDVIEMSDEEKEEEKKPKFSLSEHLEKMEKDENYRKQVEEKSAGMLEDIMDNFSHMFGNVIPNFEDSKIHRNFHTVEEKKESKGEKIEDIKKK